MVHPIKKKCLLGRDGTPVSGEKTIQLLFDINFGDNHCMKLNCDLILQSIFSNIKKMNIYSLNQQQPTICKQVLGVCFYTIIANNDDNDDDAVDYSHILFS